MTYHPNRSDPKRPFPRERSRMGGMLLPILAIVIALVLGFSIYAINRDDRAASTANSPPAATGQSTTGQGDVPRPLPMQPNAK